MVGTGDQVCMTNTAVFNAAFQHFDGPFMADDIIPRHTSIVSQIADQETGRLDLLQWLADNIGELAFQPVGLSAVSISAFG